MKQEGIDLNKILSKLSYIDDDYKPSLFRNKDNSIFPQEDLLMFINENKTNEDRLYLKLKYNFDI